MKILFLTNLLPYPLDNGGKIKTYTTLKALKNAKHSIDLICFYETEDALRYENELADICDRIYQVPLRLTTALNPRYMMLKAAQSMLSPYPFSIYKYLSHNFTKILNDLKEKNEYDYVYFDHLPMFVFYDHVKTDWENAKIILDEHNCEYIIMERNYIEAKSVIKKLFFKFETSKLKKFEKKALEKAERIVVLSEKDKRDLESLTDKKIDTVIIPIGIQPPKLAVIPKKFYLNKLNILFVGTLSWAPNNDGLLWFVEEVLPKITEVCGDFELYIVGKNPSDNLNKLCKKYKNVHITGYVESVEPYYEKCDFMIVPLFVGSGQRVKIIEGFSYGMPIISTSIGAEGLSYEDGENILIANDVTSFLTQMSKIKDYAIRKKLNINSKRTYEKLYSITAVEKRIENLIL